MYANFEQRIEFDQLQFQKVEVALFGFYLSVLYLLGILGKD